MGPLGSLQFLCFLLICSLILSMGQCDAVRSEERHHDVAVRDDNFIMDMFMQVLSTPGFLAGLLDHVLELADQYIKPICPGESYKTIRAIIAMIVGFFQNALRNSAAGSPNPTATPPSTGPRRAVDNEDFLVDLLLRNLL